MATREGVDEIFENFITEKINLLENPVCVARRLYAENVFGQYEVLCKLSDSIFPADQRDQKWIVFRDCLKDGFPVTVENLVRLASVIIECDVVKVGKKLLEEVTILPSCALGPPTEESELEKSCGKIFLEVKNDIRKQQISVGDLKSFFKQHKEFLNEAEASESTDEMVNILSEHTSLVNVFYLERLVSTFALHNTADLLKDHKALVNKFCDATSIEQACSHPLMTFLKRCLLISHTVEFLVDWKSEEKNLSDGLALIKKAFPGMADCVLLHSVSRIEFVSLMCFAPSQLHPALIKRIKENECELYDDCVISVSFGQNFTFVQNLNEKAHEATFEALEADEMALQKKIKELKAKKTILKKETEDLIRQKKMHISKNVSAVDEVKEAMYKKMTIDLDQARRRSEELVQKTQSLEEQIRNKDEKISSLSREIEQGSAQQEKPRRWFPPWRSKKRHSQDLQRDADEHGEDIMIDDKGILADESQVQQTINMENPKCKHPYSQCTEEKGFHAHEHTSSIFTSPLSEKIEDQKGDLV